MTEATPEISAKEIPLKKLDLTDFIEDGILREKAFRQRLSEFDWSIYQDETVLIKGCSETPLPTWAFMVVTAQLIPVARRILFGEPCSAVPIYKRDHP